MISELFHIITNFVINIISSSGYLGVILLMALESAAIPIPSEIIMPFAGFLVVKGQFTLWGITLAGAIGNLLGSVVLYAVGRYEGRHLLEKYGKYILISRHDIDLADRFFAKHEVLAVFVGRMLPVVRTFISLPAGVAKAPFGQFVFYTFFGSLIWSLFLGYLGVQLGENWNTLRDRFHWLDTVIIVLIVIGAVWWVWRHLKYRNYM